MLLQMKQTICSTLANFNSPLLCRIQRHLGGNNIWARFTKQTL